MINFEVIANDFIDKMVAEKGIENTIKHLIALGVTKKDMQGLSFDRDILNKVFEEVFENSKNYTPKKVPIKVEETTKTDSLPF